MLFFVKMLVVSLAALFSVSAWAGLPMAKRPFASSQEFAARVQNGNGMNATAAEYFAALEEYHPDAMRGLTSIGEYADNLEVVPCPQGVLYRLKSVEKSPRRLGEITRYFKPGEQCFKDRNIGEIVASASCGNVAKAIVALTESEQKVEVQRPTQMVETLSCPNGYYLADHSTCCGFGTELYQDGRCYPPQPQYREPPPQEEQVIVVEEYGGLDVGTAAYGYGLSQNGDRYNYRYEDNDSYQYIDNRDYPPRDAGGCSGGCGGPYSAPNGPYSSPN